LKPLFYKFNLPLDIILNASPAQKARGQQTHQEQEGFGDFRWVEKTFSGPLDT